MMLLDIVMPGIDGFEVLARVKTDPRTRHLPVVVISSVERTEDIARCIELGAEDFLPKPAEPAILRARLNAGLSRLRLHKLEQQRLRDSCARFVPEDVVDTPLREQPEDPRIGARELVSTVVFNDLRGFTTFAQQRDAAEVIDVLNEYLGLMSDTVLDRGGTLVPFLGDGMLSVFGAPVAAPDHADRALAATVQMRDTGLPRLNAWLDARGLPSGAITADRMERLYVTRPSYSTPTNLFVAADAPFQEVADLSGKSVGACAGCTMELYLRGTLELPGGTLSFPIVDPDVQPFDNEIPGLRAVAHHKLDGFVCSEPVGQDEIHRGLPLSMLPGALYETYKTGYVDRSSGLSSKAFVHEGDKIIQELHDDGTLERLSERFLGTDYATAASTFDLGALDQQVQ